MTKCIGVLKVEIFIAKCSDNKMTTRDHEMSHCLVVLLVQGSVAGIKSQHQFLLFGLVHDLLQSSVHQSERKRTSMVERLLSRQLKRNAFTWE